MDLELDQLKRRVESLSESNILLTKEYSSQQTDKNKTISGQFDLFFLLLNNFFLFSLSFKDCNKYSGHNSIFYCCVCNSLFRHFLLFYVCLLSSPSFLLFLPFLLISLLFFLLSLIFFFFLFFLLSFSYFHLIITELRADLRMKSFELTALGTAFEVRILYGYCTAFIIIIIVTMIMTIIIADITIAINKTKINVDLILKLHHNTNFMFL